MERRVLPGQRSRVHYVHVESLDRAVKQVLKLGALLRSKTAVPKTE